MRPKELDHKYEIISAHVNGVADYYSKRGQFNYSINEKPSSIEFEFDHPEIGDLGRLILNERPNDRCYFIAIRPLIPSEKDILELIYGKRYVVEKDSPLIPLIEMYYSEKELGIADYTPEDYIASGLDRKDNNRPEEVPCLSSIDEVKTTEKEMERLRIVIHERRIKLHEQVVKYIVDDLKMDNLWSYQYFYPIKEPPKPQKQPDDIQDAWKDWFSWYHLRKRFGYKVSLKEIAIETGYSISYVKEKHREFLDQDKINE